MNHLKTVGELSIGQITSPKPRPGSVPPAQEFRKVLDRTLSGSLRFSAHATERLARERPLDASQLQRLEGAVERAAAKGCRDSLVLIDGMALVVSVKNRTVVTAVSESRAREHIFTNVDSAVVVPAQTGAGPYQGAPTTGDSGGLALDHTQSWSQYR